MTNCLDPARDDQGVRLRTLRLRRGMTQTSLAEVASISPAFVSMIETGQRTLRRADHILALADALRVSPFYLADGREDGRAELRPTTGTVPFPPHCDRITLTRHQRLARQLVQVAAQDGRATGDWLRRLARDPTISPWLLLDHLTPLLAPHPAPPAAPCRS